MQKKVGFRPLSPQHCSISPLPKASQGQRDLDRGLVRILKSMDASSPEGLLGHEEARHVLLRIGEPPRARTEGPRLKRAMLYQLS